MDFSKFNITKILISFVLTLGVLLAGWLVYQELGIIKPVRKDIMAIAGVRRAEVDATAGKLSITVDLGEVERIQPFYQEIKEVLPEAALNSLTFSDHRNAYLTGLWLRHRFALEEAAVNGNFTAMRQLIQDDLSGEDIDYWFLEIDGENLYFQIHDDGYYLYAVVPRLDITRGTEKR